MSSGIGEGMPDLGPAILGLAILAVFGLWKLVEIAVWIFRHVRVEVIG